MNHSISYSFTGCCHDIDLYETLESGNIIIPEDLNDALPYLYEKHFGIKYKELGWWLIPGAKEWVKEIENKWMHNQLDLSEIYKDEKFLNSLAQKYSYKIDEETLDDLKDEFEDVLRDELFDLDNEELKELYEYDDTVNYTIEDDQGNILVEDWICLPDLEEDDDI